MTTPRAPTLWTADDWASAVLALPTDPVLPVRNVLVPNERVAHTLRRTLLLRGEGAVLVGTRFLSVHQLAYDLLRNAGEVLERNDAVFAPLLTREAIASAPLAYFRSDQLLSARGWDDAIARTLGELEGAAVDTAAMLASGDAQVRDIARIRMAVEARGEVSTSATVLHRATAHASLSHVPTLAVVTGFESAAEARFLNALPKVRFALWGVRPKRPQHEARLDALFPGLQRDNSRAAPEHRNGATDLQRLQSALFGSASTSPSDDRTVRIATYSGVHEEVEAAVAWVVEQVLAGVEAQEIAILTPNRNVYGPLLRARLSALPWPEIGNAVYSEGGVPFVERADGQRVLLVLRALESGLRRDHLADVLPLLRSSDPEALGVRGLSRAWQLLNAVACLGGERGHLEGGLRWRDAWATAIARLENVQARGGGLEEREAAHRSSLCDDLRATSRAIAALTDVLGIVCAGATLRELVAPLVEFLQAHIKLPPSGTPAWAVLASEVDAFPHDDERAPRGVAALQWLERALLDSRDPSERFGSPLLYLGTFAGARGLSFRAVRLVGLVEGAVPSAAREDPVLPDAARLALSPLLMTSRERAHRQLAAFDDAVRCARDTLALSAPRVSAERSSRQPAAVLLDVIRALQRTEGQGLERELEARAHSGRAIERALQLELPMSTGARLQRIARRDWELAPGADHPALSLAQMQNLRDRAHPGAQDGFLEGLFPRQSLPGLTVERPISASRLQTLLACPHQYLHEHLLGFRDAEGAVPSDALPANTFGTWLHEIAESFWREHGQAIAARAGDLETYRIRLRESAVRRFAELRETYPFANEEVAEAQLEALCDQLNKLLEHDWHEGEQRAFVDVERGFGYSEPCVLQTDAGPLYVRGKIDKLDLQSGVLLVRDIKTGAGKPRRGDDPPEVGKDLQLGVYAQVARALASAWGTPTDVEVAYLYLRRGEIERSWRASDSARLESHTREWLATAVETLERGAFLRTLDREDCRFCPHKPVCASELDRAEPALSDVRVPKRLAALKRGEER